MAKFGKLPPILVQEKLEFLKLVHFQIPPPTLPAKTVLPVGSLWSINMALVLPPTLSGPLSVHAKALVLKEGLFINELV